MSDAAVVDPGAAPGGAPAATPDPAPAPAGGTLAGGDAPKPADPAAAPAPAAGGTLAQPGETPPVAVPANFPEDWREKMAGDDTKLLERLKRFSSPDAVAKSYREIEQKISSGKYKAVAEPPAADAKPEEIAAWRKDQGLPDDAESFVKGLELPQGVVPGEADKPLLESFAEQATKAGWSQKQYNEAVGWYYGLQDQLVAEREQLDNDLWDEAKTELLREWGPAFKQKQNNFLNSLNSIFPQDMVGQIMSARLADGTKMFGNASVLKAWMEMYESINPVQSAMPNVPGATLASADNRIAEIEQKYMRAPEGSAEWRQYWKGPLADELRNLYGARETMRERSPGR